MKENRSKILGVLVFVGLVSGLFYLIFFSNKKINKGEIKMIKISGNNILPDIYYLKFAKLENKSNYGKLSLSEIRDKFERHPYVQKADVAYAGNDEVKVYIKEKKIEAVIIIDSEPHFISEDFQILPMLPGIKMLDVPVISNPLISKRISNLSYVRTNDIVEAFKIIDAAKMTDMNMYKKLSEINLRNNSDIILTFSGIKPPVFFGKGEEAEKMVYLDMLMSGTVNGNDLVDNSEYLDLRFSNEIYVGTDVKTGLSE
jgi:cell division septal protein FtsQ